MKKSALLMIIVPLLLYGNSTFSATEDLKSKLDKNSPAFKAGFKAGYEAGRKNALQAIPQKEKNAKRKTSIFLAGVFLTLGMPQNKVIAKVKQMYQVKKDKNSWTIISGDTKKAIGYLLFKNNQLASALKIWDSDNDHEMMDMGTAFFQVFDGLTKKEKNNVKIKTYSEQKSSNLHNTVLMTVGEKKIRLRVITGRGWNQVDIHEVL